MDVNLLPDAVSCNRYAVGVGSCTNEILENTTVTASLTISGATINLEGNAAFSVERGGILTFNSGTIQ